MIVYWKFPIMIWAFNLQSEKDNIYIIRIRNYGSLSTWDRDIICLIKKYFKGWLIGSKIYK